MNFFNHRIHTLFLLLLLTVSCSRVDQSNTATIKKIVDGDTFHIILNGKLEKIRLIGIDTPESRINAKTKKDAERSNQNVSQIISLGKAATKYVKTLVKPGDEINLELDVQTRDRYGRLLVYVYIKDGRMLNELIVGNGYASPLTYPPNVKYVELFQSAYKKAREENKGLWE